MVQHISPKSVLLQTPYDTTGSQLATEKDDKNPSPARESLPQPVEKVEESTVLHEEPRSCESSEVT